MDVPNQTALGPKGKVQYRENPRGIQLCRYFWPSENPLGVIIAVHGHGTHMGFDYLKHSTTPGQCAYEGSFVEQANNRGLSVCGLDLQGHGLSSSLNNVRCYFSRFQDLVDDLLHFVEDINGDESFPAFSGLPMVILGIGLGGCIAVNTIHQRGDLFRGAVLLAPMLSLEKITQQGANRYLRPLASVLSTLTPYWRIVKTTKNDKFPEIQDGFNDDPLCFHEKSRVRTSAEYLNAAEMTIREMPNMSFPFLVVHSRKDEMTDFEGSQKLMDLSKAFDKTFEEVNHMWHYLLKEPGHEEIVALSLDWTLQHM